MRRQALHLEVRHLWLQELVRKGLIEVMKVPGTINPADMLTKYLDGNTIKYYMMILEYTVAEGRADIAPKMVK